MADTIIDSVMNLGLLYWASDLTGDSIYRDIASRHAHRVAKLLIRPDGSTAQSVHFERATGRVMDVHTHQGISAASTWARGQGWAVYGLTMSANALRDRQPSCIRLNGPPAGSQTTAADGVPAFDDNALLGKPKDTSAGVISAAGLLASLACARAGRAPAGSPAVGGRSPAGF